ncbi:MAG: CbrC family protein [Rhodospirillales bacterium]|nr:CbrC family protein [Rhodospirillales bacterium]
MSEKLPTFRYHPDPIGTGSVESSASICLCCEHARGYIYVGPVFSKQLLRKRLCPWCIADGSAHERYGCEFTDRGGSIGDFGRWDTPPDSVMDEVAYRTPGFIGWQQERWYTHCDDAAAFLGLVGWQELQSCGQQAIDAIAGECGQEGEHLTSYLRALHRDGSPTAYLFRCLHCGLYGGYSDRD